MNTNEQIESIEETTEIIVTSSHSIPVVRRLLNVIPVDIKKLLEEIDAE